MDQLLKGEKEAGFTIFNATQQRVNEIKCLSETSKHQGPLVPNATSCHTHGDSGRIQALDPAPSRADGRTYVRLSTLRLCPTYPLECSSRENCTYHLWGFISISDLEMGCPSRLLYLQPPRWVQNEIWVQTHINILLAAICLRSVLPSI